MTRQEEVEQQNAAIRAVSAGLRALVDELHEAGLVDRQNVADRLSRLRKDGGQPIPAIQALAQAISEGAFADPIDPPVSLAVDNDKGYDDETSTDPQ